MTFSPPEPISVLPIGVVRTAMTAKFDAPHQPSDPHAKPGAIELFPGKNYEAALKDLEGFDRIWIVWFAHKNVTWRPKVLPPRGPAVRRGVFATRAPHRPNPIGLTAVTLHAIEGRVLRIGECDLIDGTPVLDIKPYLPEIDSFPSSRTGWLGEIDLAHGAPAAFAVRVSDFATEQLEWLRSGWNVEFFERARTLLMRDPSPHRTRRISRAAGGRYRMGCGPWRIFFSVNGREVLIEGVTPGYPKGSLVKKGFDRIIDRDAQCAFYERYGG